MGKEFEQISELRTAATPEQVWQAIATGPGIDSWFMGRNEVRSGSVIRTAFGGYTPQHAVTAWEPHHHLAYGGERESDGRFIAYEFLIEGRDRGSTTVRMVTSGFLPGDDWEDEYEAMHLGGALMFATLGEYLAHFPGRTAVPITAFGPQVADWQRAWATLRATLGFAAQPEPGAPVNYHAPETGAIIGEVYFANAQSIGVRTEDGIYRFVQGLPGCMVAMHHLFTDTDHTQTDRAWQRWLARVFA